jgi:hypothetical protein
MSERSMRCIAKANWGGRCRVLGAVRVGSVGELVCRNHHRHGWSPFAMPDDIGVDPRVAVRAAAVLGIDHV